MYLNLLIILVVWFEALRRSGSFSSRLPLSYRAQNISLSLLLSGPASLVVYSFWWHVLHPSFLSDYFYGESGKWPPAAAAFLNVLLVCSAHVQLHIGFLMAQRKRKGMKFALSAIPYLLALSVLNCIRLATVYSDVAKIGLPISITCTIGFYFWVYRFCKNRQNEEFLLSNGISNWQKLQSKRGLGSEPEPTKRNPLAELPPLRK